MLKINQIYKTPFSKIREAENPKNKNQIEYITLSPNAVFKSFDTSNAAFISFKGKDFYQSLDENYFKLPKGSYPDKYQKDSARAIYDGDDVLVTAPTGTGKTAIAMYAITKNMEDGKKTFYTTPLKALSNEKYRQLKAIFGEENVGLLTGDIKLNHDAPIVVMTTEIYRNMLMSERFSKGSNNLDDLKTVIFDELHYLGDVDRGGTWEQSIILSDPKTQLLSLSATIGNNEKINNWMSSVKDTQSKLVNVPPSNRHVPLEFHNVQVEGSFSRFGAGSRGESKKNNKKNNKVDNQPSPVPSRKAYMKIVSDLNEKDRLPAILFIFSKNAGNRLLDTFDVQGEELNNKEEVREILKTIDRYKRNNKYLGLTLNVGALLKGYAVHNSGLLPAQKELVEELFQKKLVKVVIATETLAAGINMPARTTIISSDRKPTSFNTADKKYDDGKKDLTPNELHQMAGRAGRRGIDKIGYCYTLSTTPKQKSNFDMLINSKPNDLKSQFNPDFSFVAGYYKYTQNDSLINEIMRKSLYAHDENPQIADDKFDSMMNLFEKKKDALKKFNFMNGDNTLTDKGELLTKLNGYSQIPLIEIVHTKRLDSLSPIELAASVAAMMRTDEEAYSNMLSDIKYLEQKKFQEIAKQKPKNAKGKNNHKCSFDPVKPEFKHENGTLKWFVDELDEFVDIYNSKMASSDKKFKKIAQDYDVTKHVYDWANLNAHNENSLENWSTMFEKDTDESIRDEGSLFREITQTIDLLKQIDKIADAGIDIANNQKDIDYYLNLKSTITASIELLSKEPISYGA